MKWIVLGQHLKINYMKRKKNKMKTKIRDVYIELIKLRDKINEYQESYDLAYSKNQKVNKIKYSVNTLLNDIDNYRFF